MKTHPYQSLKVKLNNPTIAPFFSLLQKGFFIEARAGSTIKDVLCEQFQIKPQYLEDRIQTIFLDGKPVDEADKTIVASGSTLALSAAMPGLVGSTFRRGGPLAAFRSSITHHQDEGIAHAKGSVRAKIKLFNLLVRELGPGFLKIGILLNQKDFIDSMENWSDSTASSIQYVELNGRKISNEQLDAINWSEGPEDLLLSVQ